MSFKKKFLFCFEKVLSSSIIFHSTFCWTVSQVKLAFGRVPSWRSRGPGARRKLRITASTEARWVRALSLFSGFCCLKVASLCLGSPAALKPPPHSQPHRTVSLITRQGWRNKLAFRHVDLINWRERGTLSVFLPAQSPNWPGNMIISKVRLNKSIPYCFILYVRLFFFLVRMWAAGAYTSSQFLSANRFQGEHRWAQLRATMWRTPRCEGLYESSRHHLAERGRAARLVECRQRNHASKRKRLNDATEIHLAYITSADHHPQSRSWKSRLPAPSSICLIPRALCGWKRLNGVGSEQMLKSQGFAQPPNGVRT